MVRKKLVYTIFTLILLLSFSLVTTLPVSAANLEVGPGKTYTDIGSAVAAAAAGDTIEVYDGTYNEHVVINKELTIVAAVNNSPVVDGGGSGTCFAIYKDTGLNNVTISGFEIQNARYGIWIYGAAPSPSTTYTNLTFSNNYVHNHTDVGVYVTDAIVTGLVIDNSILSNSAHGFACAQKTMVTDLLVSDCSIVDNTSGAGLSLIGTTGISSFNNVTITNCYFEGNSWEHIDLGLWSGNPTLSNVEITRCRFMQGSTATGFWCAVYVQSNFSSGDVVLRCNEFYKDAWGVCNTTAYVVDAMCNWWGAIDGPSGIGPGSGAIVWDNVYYEPWLLSSDEPCYGYDGIADCFKDVKNHGQFVSCIAKFTQSLVKDGTITAEQRAAIINWAAQSDIGK